MTTNRPPAPTTRDRVLQAALAVVAAHGIHGLTHGRVDVAAGLPRGSTSNHFRSRAALLHGTVDHLAASEQAMFAGGGRPRTVEELVGALITYVHDATGPGRDLTAVRLAFFAEATHDPQVKETLLAASSRLRAWAAQILEELGIPRPFEAARRVLAQVDGVILHGVALGEDAVTEQDLDAVVRSCLR